MLQHTRAVHQCIHIIIKGTNYFYNSLPKCVVGLTCVNNSTAVSRTCILCASTCCVWCEPPHPCTVPHLVICHFACVRLYGYYCNITVLNCHCSCAPAKVSPAHLWRSSTVAESSLVPNYVVVCLSGEDLT